MCLGGGGGDDWGRQNLPGFAGGGISQNFYRTNCTVCALIDYK